MLINPDLWWPKCTTIMCITHTERACIRTSDFFFCSVSWTQHCSVLSFQCWYKLGLRSCMIWLCSFANDRVVLLLFVLFVICLMLFFLLISIFHFILYLFSAKIFKFKFTFTISVFYTSPCEFCMNFNGEAENESDCVENAWKMYVCWIPNEWNDDVDKNPTIRLEY